MSLIEEAMISVGVKDCWNSAARVPDDGERNIFRAWSRRSRLRQSIITDSKRARLRSAKDMIE